MSKPLPAPLQAAAQDRLARGVQMVSDVPVTVQDNVGYGPTNVQLSDERVKREEANGFSDYLGAAYRQDMLINGMVGWYAGTQMQDDPSYNVWGDPDWADVDKNIDPSYHSWLAEAKSAAQFQYIKGRIQDKQDDLQKLGDLGMLGNAGRFALGFVDPAAILSGYTGGLIYKGYHGYRVSRAAKAVQATTGSAQIRAGANLVGEVSRAPSIALGATSAAGQNAAYEKIRQSVNFEDSTAQVIEAGLMGAALSAPFIMAGTRAQRRVAAAAAKEREALHLLADAQEGKVLTPEQQKHVADTFESIGFIKRVDEGMIAPDEVINMDFDWMVRNGMVSDESITLGGTAKAPRVSTDAERPQAVDGIEVVDGTVENIDAAPAPARPLTTRGLEVDEPPVVPNEGIEVKDALWEDFMPPTKVTNTAMGDKLKAALGVAEQKQADAALAAQKDDAFARAEADAAAQRERDFTAAEAQRDLQDAADDIPFGFGKKSIGSGEGGATESVADQRTWATKTPTFKLNGKDYYIPTRFDFYATLNGSDNVMVRRLAYDLIKDPIQNDADYAQAMTASEWKSQTRRALMGNFFNVAREARLEAAKVRGKTFWGRHDFTTEFNSLVTKVTRGGQVAERVLAANADIAAQIKKASAAQKEMYGKFLEEMKAAGVKGADQVDPNQFYVNRVWKHDMIRKVGVDEAVRIIAASVKDPALRGDAKSAEKFVRTIMRLEYSPVLREISAGVSDMAYVRHQLEKAGLRGDEIDETIGVLLAHDPRADAGRAPNLKYRWDLDETVDVNGKSVSDLTENDAFLLADLYGNSMSGHIGLAKVGIRSAEDWGTRIKEVTEAHEAMGGDAQRLERDLKLLDDVYAHITGRPMSTADFSPSARIASALRGYTRSTTLGQLGLLSMFEIRQALALSSARAIWHHSPSFGKIIDAFRKGYVPDNELSRSIRAWTGFGNELSMSYMREAEVSEFGMEMGLTNIERGANLVSHATDVLSGNRNATSLTRNVTAMAMVQKHADWAFGRGKPADGDLTRMVGQGVSKDDFDDLMAALKRYAVVDEAGLVKNVEYEKWKAEAPDSHDRYLTVLNRETRDAIQDHDIGETMPWMHTTLGKVMAELKTFFLVGHAKNFLKNASYRDVRALQVFTISYVGEMLAYSMQQAINYNHDPAKLEERLAPEKIALAAWGRASALGITSYLYGSAHKLATGEDPFTGLTANTGNRTFLPPSVQTIQNLMSVPGTAADFMLGRTATEGEVKSSLRTIPFSNGWGVRQGIDYFSSMQPKTDE